MVIDGTINRANQVKTLKIAYIGPAYGTSLHRARALQRLGHQVTVIDPWSWLGKSKWVSRWLFHAGGIGNGLLINQRLYEEAKRTFPDLIWVDQGPFLSPECIKKLRMIGVPIVNYAIDDPFGQRDGLRFYYYRKAVPYYDLLAVVRKENVEEARQLGAKRVVQVWRSADEIVHSPRKLSQEEKLNYASQVAFIGTWMPERGPFLAELIRLGIPLSIWGDRWQKAPEWVILKPYWRSSGLTDDKTYSAAIMGAKICLGLLSKGNRDSHTTRSIEIPSLGGLLCAERTSEHLALYQEGVEAVFWEDAVECVDICKEFLVDDNRRMEIARNGHVRALRNNLFNEPILASIIKTVMGDR